MRMSEDALQHQNPACKAPGADALPEMQKVGWGVGGGGMASFHVLLCRSGVVRKLFDWA